MARSKSKLCNNIKGTRDAETLSGIIKAEILDGH